MPRDEVSGSPVPRVALIASIPLAANSAMGYLTHLRRLCLPGDPGGPQGGTPSQTESEQDLVRRRGQGANPVFHRAVNRLALPLFG